jgi:SPX domain protein involved in polyphosphate accumulation
MKFEKQLRFHAVPTWKRKYINYGDVKAVLRRIGQTLREEKVGALAVGGLEEDGAAEEEALVAGRRRAVVEEELEELELDFFRRLREEQAKVDAFYHQQLEHLLVRAERLTDQLRHFEAASQAF